MDAQEEKYIKMTTPPVEKLICRLAAPLHREYAGDGLL